MSSSLRTRWSLDGMITAVGAHVDKYRKAGEFWQEVGSVAGHSGPETETLFKNLHSEYQRLRIAMHVSGAETAGQPALRNSESLYRAYELYYSLFYPQGGSDAPVNTFEGGAALH